MRENIQPYVEVFSKSKNSLTFFFDKFSLVSGRA